MRGETRTPEFRALPRFSTTDVADALQVARAGILRYLEQRRVITLDSDADSDVLTVSEELAERDPALSQLAAVAVSGGPELRRNPRELASAGRPGVVIDARRFRCAKPASACTPRLAPKRPTSKDGKRC